MSVRRTEVSSVRFEINARPASVSMEALQAKADDLNKDIDIVKKNIADLGNVSPEHEGLKSYQKQLADLNKKLKDVQTTMKDYTRGVKAADELLKAYDAGNIESLSMKAIKAGQNGLKKRIENIKPETANEEELKAYRIITEVIRESQRVVDTFKTDARETIQILEQGGTVAEATLKKTRDGVRDLMQTTKEGSKEYRDYQKQFEFLADKMKQMETESARVSGQKMLGRAFRGDFATADKKTLEEVIAKLREYQSVIDDPNGKGARIFAAAEKQIKSLSEQLAKTRGDIVSVEQAMEVVGQAGTSVEKMDQSLKVLEDAKRKATDPTLIEKYGGAIDTLNQKIKESTGEWMSLADAEKLAEQAGENYYLSEGKSGFVASPEEIQKATQALERQRDALIKTIQTKKANGEATAAEERKLDDLTKKLRDLKFEQDNVNMSQEKMRMLMKQPAQAVSLDELRAAIKRADGELRRMEGSLGKNSKEYKAFAEQVKVAKNTLKDMEGAAKASASAWEKAWSRLKTYVGLYMGFNIMWQKVTGAASDLLDLSDRMGEVRKTTQMTADQVGRLSDALTKLDTRTSLTGLMEFSSLAGSIGLKTQEDVQGFTEAANMLSVSLPELGSEASRTLMKIADATGDLEKNGNNVRETLERVGSTVIALRANSAAAAGPITDFVSRVGAVGAQAGISIDQIAALGATVDALGGRVEMSATALSRMIPAIRNNTFEVAQAIGMTEKQLKSMSGIDQMVAVFKALHDSVKNFDMTTEEGMNAAADAVEGMLGRSVSMQDVMKQLNQQGARAGIVFGLLSQNVDTLEKQLRIAGDAYKDNTALMDEYNKMNDTAAAKWERLKNTIEEWFVSDKMQRILGDLIDIVRKFADWFGSDGPLATGFKMMIAYAMAMKVEFGAAFMGIGGGLKAIGTAFGSFVNVLATGATAAVGNLAGMTKGLRGLRMATIGARREWLKMDAAMKANVIGAVITAIGLLVYKLYDMHRASKEAAAEVGRFNQKMADERKALNSLFDPLNKSNLAQKERLDLIKQINDKYGRYLGYMLSETSSAIQLADAHALIAKRIREEAYQRRLAEKERKIQEEHDEDLSAAYGGIESAVRSGAKGNADITAMADMLKSFADKNLNNVEIKWSGGYRILQGFTKDLNGMLERMAADGKLRHDDIREVEKAVYDYASEAKKQHDDIMSQTSNLRSDLRGIQGAIKYDLANNLNTLISNVANSVSRAVSNAQQHQQTQQQNVPLMLQGTQGGGVKLPSLFGGGQQGGWQAPWQQGSNRETTPQQQMAPKGWKPNIDKKDTEAVRQFVQDQEALRSALNASGNQIDEAQRRVAESWLLTDAELKEYKKIVEKADRGPGGSNHNPYGDYNDRVDPYEQWDANALVARRKEMLERVKALANGADVQAVLSEDKRFMDEATRKGIKNMRDAIAWYNEERLKIQEELDARNLTPTGDWKNPEKGGRSKKKPKTPESEGAIAELDRYYSERKELIEEARANEQMTEAEYNRRLDALEQEHLTKRSELRQTFTSEDKQFIQQFRQWWASVKELDEVSWTAIEAEWIAAWERDRKYNNREAQKDLTAMQAIVVKQLKEIEAIIAKERPFNGITDNLQNNLTKMGLLFKDGVPEDGKFMKENTNRLTFLLKEAENAYSLTFDQLAEDMRKNGLGSWADAIINSENADKEKRALIAQLHEVYDQVQDAIKKEASQVKKQVDIAWNDAILPNGKSMKATYEAAISALGVEQSSVSRANNLIGAGVASERVADRLAIKQLQLQLRMQEHYYNLVRKTGQQRVDDLLREAKLREDEGKTNEAERLRLDAKHAQMSLNLSLAKEETELAKQREEIIARTEESQNRLYTELKEWADLLSSSLQSVFEASNAGNAEYYNERAKLDLTGKGGPGAGTYIVIDDAGTSDAKAHYEYLDERQALERQHEIEQQNAQAEAWKKVMDDINMKMSDQITDWVNAYFQSQSIDANTQAVLANTQAIYASMGQGTGTGEGITRNAEGFAIDEKGQVISPIQPTEPTSQPEAETPAWKPFWQMTDEEKAKNQENMTEMFGLYRDLSVQTETEKAELLAEVPGYTPPAISMTDEQIESVGEKLEALNQKEIDASKKKTQAILTDQQAIKQGELQTDKTMTQSSKNMYAAMMSAANLYGVAYQAMTNDNLSAEQKFQMIALQAAGQSAIAFMQTRMIESESGALMSLPEILAKCLSINPIAGAAIFAVLSALLGVAIGAATSKLAKGKAEVAQVTGASASAGKLATGMLTYAEGNVNEFTDPASLTPGRQYNVDGADGKTYRARYMGKDVNTHITNGPEFHLVGEKGREAIIDAHTTRLMQTDDTGIWQAIQTLYNGGRVSGFSTRRGRGVRAFAEGNINDFEDVSGSGMEGAEGFDDFTAMQDSLDRNTAVQEALLERLNQPIVAQNVWTGPEGIPNMVNKYQKEAKRHGVKYL